MRFGVALPNFGPLGTRAALVEMAQLAEALGYDSVWMTALRDMRRFAAEVCPAFRAPWSPTATP